jgi:hypothetical protein
MATAALLATLLASGCGYRCGEGTVATNGVCTAAYMPLPWGCERFACPPGSAPIEGDRMCFCVATPQPDGGADAGPDAPGDALSDAPLDAMPDASIDAPLDPAADEPAPDIADAGPDADAAADASVDAPADAGTTIDAPADGTSGPD